MCAAPAQQQQQQQHALPCAPRRADARVHACAHPAHYRLTCVTWAQLLVRLAQALAQPAQWLA